MIGISIIYHGGKSVTVVGQVDRAPEIQGHGCDGDSRGLEAWKTHKRAKTATA